MTATYQRLRWLALVALVALARCGGSSEAPDVPPTLAIVQGASVAINSGESVALSVRATDQKGRVAAATDVRWTTADSMVVSVSATGTIRGRVLGQASVTASYAGVTASTVVTVSPGAPATLVVRTAPAGASAGTAFTTQPVIELRDGAGNLATTATTPVSVSIALGGGSLLGATTVNASAGVASFTSLALDGVVGERVLRFSASGLPAVDARLAVVAGAPVALGLRTQPDGAVAGSVFTTQPVIEVRDASGNVSNVALPVTATISGGGGLLAGNVTVTSVAGVATFTNLAISGAIGTRTLSFSTPALAASVASTGFVLRAGAPVALALRTAPTGGGLNQPFAEQPVVEARDGSGNVATSATGTVDISIASGGGSVTGAVAPLVQGVATFSGFSVVGTAGARTLTISAPNLPPIATIVRPCDAQRGPAIALAATSRTLSALVAGPVVLDLIALNETVGSCILPGGLQASVNNAAGATWLTVSLNTSRTALELRADPRGLAVGSYTATAMITTSNAGTITLPITLNVTSSFPIVYGAVDQKLLQLDPGGSVKPITIVSDNQGAPVAQPVSYQSRSPSSVTVASDGTITARAEGAAWIVARVSGASGLADSLFVNVTGGAGPVLRTNATRIAYDRNSTFSITLQLDTRGVTVGAAQLIFSWPSNADVPGFLQLTDVVNGGSGSTSFSIDNATGTARISMVSATGFNGLITVARFDFKPITTGSSLFTTRFVDLLAPDQRSLLGNASALLYPVVVR